MIQEAIEDSQSPAAGHLRLSRLVLLSYHISPSRFDLRHPVLFDHRRRLQSGSLLGHAITDAELSQAGLRIGMFTLDRRVYGYPIFEGRSDRVPQRFFHIDDRTATMLFDHRDGGNTGLAALQKVRRRLTEYVIETHGSIIGAMGVIRLAA